MTIDELAVLIPELSSLSHATKIKLFAWTLHSSGRVDFRVADIRAAYAQLHLDPPSNLARSIEALAEKRPPEVLRQAGAYRLHANARLDLDRKYGKTASTIAVEEALQALPGKVTNENEKSFLFETLTCYRHRAFRAAIVMVWNLAYDHLLHWLLSDATRINTFNAGIAKRNPRKAYLTIVSRDDFEDLKEEETIDIAASVPGISGGMKKVLKEKLGRRNTYAHPSTLSIEKAQVDDMITDLVNNIVLRLQ